MDTMTNLVEQSIKIFSICTSLDRLDEKGNLPTQTTYQGFLHWRRTFDWSNPAMVSIAGLKQHVLASFYFFLLLRLGSTIKQFIDKTFSSYDILTRFQIKCLYSEPFIEIGKKQELKEYLEPIKDKSLLFKYWYELASLGQPV